MNLLRACAAMACTAAGGGAAAGRAHVPELEGNVETRLIASDTYQQVPVMTVDSSSYRAPSVDIR
jgi:hypothetical protein